jgi:hypothetical protein
MIARSFQSENDSIPCPVGGMFFDLLPSRKKCFISSVDDIFSTSTPGSCPARPFPAQEGNPSVFRDFLVRKNRTRRQQKTLAAKLMR